MGILEEAARGSPDHVNEEVLVCGRVRTLLSMLGERNLPAAERLVAKHVLDFDRYNCDAKTFRATRRELLELLSAP